MADETSTAPAGSVTTIEGDTITHAAPAMGVGQGMGVGQMLIWVIVALVFFALLATWFASHNRLNDVHANTLLGHQSNGFIQKQLNDMQYDGRQNLNRQYDWRLDELRFGQPIGNHTQHLHSHRAFPGQIVGSNLTSSNAVDGSVGNLGTGSPF